MFQQLCLFSHRKANDIPEKYVIIHPLLCRNLCMAGRYFGLFNCVCFSMEHFAFLEARVVPHLFSDSLRPSHPPPPHPHPPPCPGHRLSFLVTQGDKRDASTSQVTPYPNCTACHDKCRPVARPNGVDSITAPSGNQSAILYANCQQIGV